ncbi:hypothetical protein, partial [Anaplasma phagocytophilum]|uniref:hypothetical protein n=1 Tax=Anaplasma phagocytophilum TaxID=948 RepID=UPI000A44658F
CPNSLHGYVRQMERRCVVCINENTQVQDAKKGTDIEITFTDKYRVIICIILGTCIHNGVSRHERVMKLSYGI